MVFNPIKKNKKEYISTDYDEEYSDYSEPTDFTQPRPLQPISQFPPQPQDDLQLVLSKLDLLNTKMDNLIQNLNIRLQNLEQRISKIEKIAEESQKPSRW